MIMVLVILVCAMPVICGAIMFRVPIIVCSGEFAFLSVTVKGDKVWVYFSASILARCYDPPPFFSSPSTVTYTPAVPAPAPLAAPAPAPPQHVPQPPAAPAPSYSTTAHLRHHLPQPMEDQQAEPQLTETEQGSRPVLSQLDTEALQQPPVSRAPSAAPPSSDHLPFPMLTDDIAPTEYALEWLTGHPDRPMQGEGLETVQVPSVRPLSPDSPVSAQ